MQIAPLQRGYVRAYKRRHPERVAAAQQAWGQSESGRISRQASGRRYYQAKKLRAFLGRGK